MHRLRAGCPAQADAADGRAYVDQDREDSVLFGDEIGHRARTRAELGDIVAKTLVMT